MGFRGSDMGRFSTVVGLLAVLAAGGAHAAGQLAASPAFETQVLGATDGVVPAPYASPWSSDNTIFRARDGGQSYEVLVDGVQVGAFSTSAAPDFNPNAAPPGPLPAEARGRPAGAGKVGAIAPLLKPAAWSLVILGFAAIGLTLRGGRRTEAASV